MMSFQHKRIAFATRDTGHRSNRGFMMTADANSSMPEPSPWITEFALRLAATSKSRKGRHGSIDSFHGMLRISLPQTEPDVRVSRGDRDLQVGNNLNNGEE